MADWHTVPCLLTLRAEFDAVSPGRDRGADGTKGDSNHSSSSDHTPDEDSDVLRDRDADSSNEVHALDIDSTGPWPGGAAWFDAKIKAIVARERAEYESTALVGRLRYVIWNRRIAERSNGWNWRAYTLDDPHTNHAHFSARYESGPEADTRPWGVQEDDDMALADELLELTDGTTDALGKPHGTKMTGSILLQTVAIRTVRAEANAATAATQAKTATEQGAAATARLTAIETWINSLSAPQTPVEQTVIALRAALGERAAEVGRLLAGS